MLIFQIQLVMEPKMVSMKAALSTRWEWNRGVDSTKDLTLPRCTNFISVAHSLPAFQIHPSLGHLSNIIASTHGKHIESILDGHYRGRNHSDMIFLGSGLKSWEGSHLWGYHVDSFKTQSAPKNLPCPSFSGAGDSSRIILCWSHLISRKTPFKTTKLLLQKTGLVCIWKDLFPMKSRDSETYILSWFKLQRNKELPRFKHSLCIIRLCGSDF